MTRPPRKLIIISSVIGAVVVLAIIGAALPDQVAEPAAVPDRSAIATSATSAPSTTNGPFDASAFAAWWSSGAVPPSVQAVTGPERIHWNGVALAAETSIVKDSDAQLAAKAVCSTLSAYWLTTPSGFRPVQVIGADGGVLVSRALVTDQCEWRG